ncbi:DNA-binding transcriptional regulator, MarR family [Cohaesibacter sp. ES.047]|uniref:MarR family winged helix-turn-helix transcriptional regulator n=1 Tax=Cohaesibacter sp. ES.047 TaxID=1798205 RepID=UPI000BBF803F|nr:MarR family winged helix-turn-helix transcriptional regulator [Cohaesibacter sp. ES.047]SNY92120.1 DNA-binding transcriptional regulator, MarR family [Cohaesibacter sp. ES.047]
MSVNVEEEYPRCLFLNTVKTARSLTRKYDRTLAPYGTTSMQYFVMMFLRYNEGRTINEIATLMDLDRSTLTRNLDGLVRKELVVKKRADKGNGRVCMLTDKGQALLDQLIPLWLEARETMKTRLAEQDVDEYRAVLHLLGTM